MSLDISAEFNEVRDRYREASQSRLFNALVYGNVGTGKTYSLRTAPKPVLIDSFDPGGTKSLSDVIRTGEVIPDSRWEASDPKTYDRWEREFEKRRRRGWFDHVGTYVIDSITSWSELMLDRILEKNGRAANDQTPVLRDYQIQMYTIRDIIKVCTGLPCHFIAIGHIDTEKDEVTGRTFTYPMVTGKLKTKLPGLFDEVYVAQAENTAKGINYQFLTKNDGRYKARSRLATEANLGTYVPQDYELILKEAGLTPEDKPLFFDGQGNEPVTAQ